MSSDAPQRRPVFVKHKGSRRRPQVGDIFRLRFPDTAWIFGRVAMLEFAPGAPFADVMAYFFKTMLDEPDGAGLDLRVSNLALPPMLISRGYWTDGEFQHVRSAPEFGPGELLPVHCFGIVGYDKFVDHNGRPLERRYEPCGKAAVPSGGMLCTHIYSAIHGLPHTASPAK